MANDFDEQEYMRKLIAGGIAGILTSWNSLLLGASRLVYSLAIQDYVGGGDDLA